MKEYKTGDFCHKCKTGRIALASQLVDRFDLGQEPYESGKLEKNGEEIKSKVKDITILWRYNKELKKLEVKIIKTKGTTSSSHTVRITQATRDYNGFM